VVRRTAAAAQAMERIMAKSPVKFARREWFSSMSEALHGACQVIKNTVSAR
jgi:hypothetical protein